MVDGASEEGKEEKIPDKDDLGHINYPFRLVYIITAESGWNKIISPSILSIL